MRDYSDSLDRLSYDALSLIRLETHPVTGTMLKRYHGVHSEARDVMLMALSKWSWIAWGVFAAFVLFFALAILYGTRVPGSSYRGALAPLSDEERAIETELRAHVEKLAGEIGERNMFLPAALEAAAAYIRAEFTAMGYAVRAQEYTTQGKAVKNLEAELPAPQHSPKRGEIVIFGAHYDSVAGAPGANDNASGVAALLALARRARAMQLARTVRFVAFVNEEPPFFTATGMGSRVYARACRERGDKIVAMLSLETLGYYTDAPSSQQYPFPFGLLYPSTGNFVTFVGNFRSRDLLHRAMRAFREQTKFPSEGAAAPEAIPGIGWSDHWAFWKEGYPAIMVTDTALFRYPHYHTTHDTPDKLTYDRMARVTRGLLDVLTHLASD
jgi:hypothetical protein